MARYPQMENYYEDFTSVLRDYVVMPSLEDNGESEVIDTDFKTQRNESLNALFKLKIGKYILLHYTSPKL